MKITPIDYAQALYESTHDKEREEQVLVVHRFVEKMRRQGHVHFLHRVLHSYQEICNRKNGRIPVTLRSVDRVQSEIKESVKDFALTLYPDGKEVEIEEKKDENLIGGMVIEVYDRRFDMSISRKFQAFKKYMMSSRKEKKS